MPEYMLISVNNAVTICRLTFVQLHARRIDMLSYAIPDSRMADYLNAYADGLPTTS